MQRLLTAELKSWKTNPGRLPLILQGARQCGKTWLLKYFGEQEFEDTAYFNFEHDTWLFEIFEADMNPARIVTMLGLARKKSIVPGKTLLILDEIQQCPRALTSLKYFAEEYAELHVAVAGSLLGVTLSQMEQSSSFPVGKVQTLTLHPLNFEEFLLANGEDLLISHLRTHPKDTAVFTAVGDRLKDLYAMYLITGGMPASVQTWIDTKSIEDVDAVLSSILSDYEKDFIKYAPKSEFPKLSAVWEGIPGQLARENQKFIFSRVKSGARAKDLEDALYWLAGAGIIQKVTKIERPMIPLLSYADVSFFKIYLSDTGLLRRLAGFDASMILDKSETTAYMRGMLAENFVLSELHAVLPADSRVCFWRSGNTAEVDFVFQYGGQVIPVEVKAGKNTRAKSLAQYRKKYLPQISLRMSLNKTEVHEDEFGTVIELPLYLLWNLKNCLHE